MRTSVDIQKALKDARNGDKEAFGKLYDTYLDAVYRFVYFRVGVREVAEDITETAFVSVFEHIGEYKEQGVPFEAWLFRIARNKLIDHYRSHKPNVPIDEIADAPDGATNVEHEVEVKLTKEYIMDCVRRLPASYQEIIILKYIEEKTNEEISELLEKPLPHVRVLQSRALAKLRSILTI